MANTAMDLKIVALDREYAAIPLATLQQWAGEGRLLRNDLVRPNAGAHWAPVGDVPELAALLPGQAEAAFSLSVAETETQEAEWTGPGPAQDGAPRQEAPHYELPYSGLASFAFHFCVMMLLPLLAMGYKPPDLFSGGTEVSIESGGGGRGGGDGEGEGPGDALAAAETLQTKGEADEIPLPASTPPTAVNAVEEAEIDETDLEKLSQEIQQGVEQSTNQGQKFAASAAGQLAKLNERLGGGGPGSGGGEGGGTGTGSGTGSGSGRGGRTARWVLHFETRSARDYLAQFGGLGAEIAFPQRGDQWLFFDLSKSPPQSQSKDLSSENRIYWVDDDPQSVRAVAAELGISVPEFMTAFLPVALEQEMLEMELAYQGAPNEDAVLQTEFKVVPRGGGYGVIVVNQKLK